MRGFLSLESVGRAIYRSNVKVKYLMYTVETCLRVSGIFFLLHFIMHSVSLIRPCKIANFVKGQ
jgi:hypothetical protein